MGYSPWGCKESDTTEWLSTHTTNFVLLISWSGPYCHIQAKLWCPMVLAWGLGDAASDSFSEAVEIHDLSAERKNAGLKFKAFCSWSCCLLPLQPAHLCQSLKYSPTWAHIGSSSVETYCPSGIIWFYVFTFVNSFLYSFHKSSVVTSGYKKQQTVFHCGLSYSECGTKSVKELQKIDSLTMSVLHDCT